MKYSKKLLITAALAASVSSAHAIETTITFEGIANSNMNLPDTVIGDVTFESIGRTTPMGSFKFAAIPTESIEYSGYSLLSGGTNTTGLTFSFEDAVNSLSMNLGYNLNEWELTAYNLTGTQIGSSQSIPGLNNVNEDHGGVPFSLVSNDYDISYVTLMNLGPPKFSIFEDQIVVDNFTYNTEAVTPVPEPSTYALMLGGLGMVGFMAYRRRKETNA